MTQAQIIQALTAVSYLLMIATFIGTLTFIYNYKPWNPRRHGRAGRHLLHMSYALLALYGVSLFGIVVPIDPLPGMVVTVIVLAGICYAVWDRVLIARQAKRLTARIDRERRKANEREDARHD